MRTTFVPILHYIDVFYSGVQCRDSVLGPDGRFADVKDSVSLLPSQWSRNQSCF